MAKTTKTKEERYSVLIEVNDTELVGKGATVIDALNDVEKFQPKTKAVITVKKGTKKFPQNMAIFQLKRLMLSKMTQVFFQKRAELMLK